MAYTREEILNKLLTIGQAAMPLATDGTLRAQVTIKPDNSVLTATDLAIAKLTHSHLADWIKGGDHLLIDEEDPKKHTYFNDAAVDGATYLWSIDPIDGTRNYAAGLPVYGVSIGVLKNRKPWLGMVIMPHMDEMYLHDGNDTWYVTNPFSPQERRHALTPPKTEITDATVIITNETFQKTRTFDVAQNIILGASVVDLCWVAHGRALATPFKGRLWDFAGPWAILHALGHEMRHIDTGAVMDSLDLSLFVDNPADPWLLRDYHLVAPKGMYTEIVEKYMVSA
jgi:myo-inositol-1(or 4)-monophosphatase